MSRKAVSGIMVTLLLIGMLTLTFNIQPVRADPKIIYVDDDNTVGPWEGTQENPYQNITSGIEHASTRDTIYVYNGSYYEHVVVSKTVSLIGEDKEITTIDGSETGNTVTIDSENVQVANFTIKNGYFSCILVWSSGNILENNRVLGAGFNATFWGIYLSGSNNTVLGNSIENSGVGIFLESSSYNKIVQNTVLNNHRGIWLKTAPYIPEFPPPPPSSFNTVYHNNLIDNNVQAWDHGFGNTWNVSYPIGGNYWSNYNGSDLYGGLYQNTTGSDGIGDTPYIIDENDQDMYPLIYPYGHVPSPDINQDGKVNIYDVVLIALAYGSKPGFPVWNPYCDINQDGIINLYDVVIACIHYGQEDP